MKVAIYEKYGTPDVVEIKDITRPEPGNNDVLVQIFSTSVTTADWRLRASAFPGAMWLIGRLMFGICAPRNKVLGVEFAGRVVAVGEKVTRFKMGDAVFGFTNSGAHAEYLVVSQDGAISKKPEALSYDEAATLPFGAVSALMFLRDFAQVKPGQSVLIAGASGGVGVYAVQLAKFLGAEVTAITSTHNIELVKSLGADHVIDYKREDFSRSNARYDFVIDTAGTLSLLQALRALKPTGTFVPIEFKISTGLWALVTKLFTGKKILLNISSDTQENIAEIAELAAEGNIRAVIDSRYTLDNIADAYRRVETRHKTGGVIIHVTPPVTQQLAAA